MKETIDLMTLMSKLSENIFYTEELPEGTTIKMDGKIFMGAGESNDR